MFDRNRFRGMFTLLLVLSMVVFLAQVVTSASAAVAAADPPEQPRTFLNTTYSPPTGGTVTVNAGDDLQAALDTVQPNQILSLAAGATFTGNFELPNKTGAGWIYIRHTNFIYRDNISNHGDYGVFGSGLGTGTVALETCAPGYEFVANIIAGGEPEYYPPGNFMEPPDSLDEVGFVDLQGGDYRLAPNSPYKNVGTDSLDPGADHTAVLAATQGVLTGR